jgi:hypothetical protein
MKGQHSKLHQMIKSYIESKNIKTIIDGGDSGVYIGFIYDDLSNKLKYACVVKVKKCVIKTIYGIYDAYGIKPCKIENMIFEFMGKKFKAADQDDYPHINIEFGGRHYYMEIVCQKINFNVIGNSLLSIDNASIAKNAIENLFNNSDNTKLSELSLLDEINKII